MSSANEPRVEGGPRPELTNRELRIRIAFANHHEFLAIRDEMEARGLDYS